MQCQTKLGRSGAGGATVRRQSMPSTSRASCAGISFNEPSMIGKRDLTTACRYAATAWGVSDRHFHGRRSSIRLIG